MAGYPKLTKTQMQMKLGRTSHMYHEGKTPEEIAETIKRPLPEVLEWIEVVKKADQIKEVKNNG